MVGKCGCHNVFLVLDMLRITVFLGSSVGLTRDRGAAGLSLTGVTAL